jgi:general stress protein 26
MFNFVLLPFRRTTHAAAVISALVLIVPAVGRAQDKPSAPADSAKVLAAAREIMTAQPYCALITLDETGLPQIRTMNPFPPDDGMVVWMATNSRSRKVEQIKKDPRVSLYYSNHTTAIGYVAITGKAVLVDDMQEILKRKRAYWDTAFPGLKNLTLIKVIPERIDVVNYKQGLAGDPVTDRSVSILLPAKPPAPQ